ncbi:unnamed protein product [Callosobruchus maculatus]|uniref:Cyclic nucleotide-binding domain-containing protein n=1 Tax=Callosobruchus maculatus TaxID=64391 RepID=A0A653DUF8_CALMS|nr:unnamed protein product [Callosobruchus maculatus]
MSRRFSTHTVGSVAESIPNSIVSEGHVGELVELTHTNNCTLPKNEDTFGPATGNKFTRWLKQLHLISIKNPLTKKYFRSENAVKEERIRHIKLNYWYIVHPLSDLRVYFDIWQLMVYIASMIVKPIAAAVPNCMRKRMPFFNELSIIMDLLCWMTIILTFFMGYIIRKTKVMVLEPKRIAWNYVGSIFFICDVLSSIPIPPLVYFIRVIFGAPHGYIEGVFYLLCQLTFIRLVSVVSYINSLSDYFRIKSKGMVFLLICIIMTIMIVHGFALLQLLIPRLVRQYFAVNNETRKMWFVKYRLHRTSFWTLYTNSMLKSSAMVLSIRNFYILSNEEEDYLLAILTYIVGKVMVCSTYVIVAVTVLNNRSMEIKFYSIINQLDEYMRQKQLPLNLRDRIKNYYNFKFQHKYFNSDRIYEMLPDKLKKEINIHECKNLIKNVSLFAHLTEHQTSTVVEMLTPEIFLPKDTIIQAGSPGDCMYFISSGTVAVFTHSGKEICHLEDGAYFGEISLVLQSSPYRCATIVAIEITHVYMLKKKDFNRCLLRNPKVMRRVIRVAHRRFNEIREQEAKFKKMLFEKIHGGADDLPSTQ